MSGFQVVSRISDEEAVHQDSERRCWIRKSTGRLCVEFRANSNPDLTDRSPSARHGPNIGPRPSFLSSPGSQQERALISQLSPHDVDILLQHYFLWCLSSLPLAAGARIPLNSVLTRKDPTIGIGYLPGYLLDSRPAKWYAYGLGRETVVSNGCTR